MQPCWTFCCLPPKAKRTILSHLFPSTSFHIFFFFWWNVLLIGWLLLQVKKLHQEGKLRLLVDKDIKGNFDRIELEEMVQVTLLCTQFNPLYRPRMSEVLRMLEGDGLADKWEACQKVETPRFRFCDNPPQRYSDFIEESSLVVEAMELSGPRWQMFAINLGVYSIAEILNAKNVIGVDSCWMLVFICKKEKKWKSCISFSF